MIAGNILAAKFPQGGIEITDVDDVAGCVADLNAVADAVRPTHEDKNPGNETLGRCLDGQTNDDRPDTERGERGIPIHKDDRDSNQRDQHSGDQR